MKARSRTKSPVPPAPSTKKVASKKPAPRRSAAPSREARLDDFREEFLRVARENNGLLEALVQKGLKVHEDKSQSFSDDRSTLYILVQLAETWIRAQREDAQRRERLLLILALGARGAAGADLLREVQTIERMLDGTPPPAPATVTPPFSSPSVSAPVTAPTTQVTTAPSRKRAAGRRGARASESSAA